MSSWNIDEINIGINNGAEVDLNIREDFPLDELKEFLKKYANQEGEIGGNILTGKWPIEQMWLHGYITHTAGLPYVDLF